MVAEVGEANWTGGSQDWSRNRNVLFDSDYGLRLKKKTTEDVYADEGK